MNKPFKRILLTGAGGKLGRRLRERLHAFADIVRPADRAQATQMCEGVDAVLHFGGVSTEVEFAPIMQANILGLVNLYEAVHKLGIRRVVFASSNHTMGMYETSQRVDAGMLPRADGYYDLVELPRRALVTPRVGHTIAFGVSDNPGRWWDDREARHLAFQAKDSSAQFPLDGGKPFVYPPEDRLSTFLQGGMFVTTGPTYPQ